MVKLTAVQIPMVLWLDSEKALPSTVIKGKDKMPKLKIKSPESSVQIT